MSSPMSSPVVKQSVIKEIGKVEISIKESYDRIHELETKISQHALTDEQRNIIKRELIEVKKLLVSNEDQLRKLHYQNAKSFAVAAAVVFAIFLLYGVYALFFLEF